MGRRLSPLESFTRAPFEVGDVFRRAQGDALDALGLGPSECPWRELSSGSHWRLRDYGGLPSTPALLIVAAPIKRPYIWDLDPSTSVVRLCLEHGLHVHLVEWLPASPRDTRNGIDEYAHAICECVATISDRDAGARPFLMGHSLGGTLAAIFGAWLPERIRGLVLLGTPLCFAPGSARFRDALTALIPRGLSEEALFPGTLLSQVSAVASPETFVWSRLMDAAFSIGDIHALAVHARVERWALDEVPLPGRLAAQIVDWLYREDRFIRGALDVDGTAVGPSRLSVPTLAVATRLDQVAPRASMQPFIDSMPSGVVRVLEHHGDIGVALQHLAVLIGRQAHARLWPEILAWLGSHR
jgi:poly[(R)-3-hydroxyalkanoate] polymerase subunit PhaC